MYIGFIRSLMDLSLLFLVAFSNLWIQLHPQLSMEGDLSLNCLCHIFHMGKGFEVFLFQRS